MNQIDGYWVEEEETGEVGFLPTDMDIFWTRDDALGVWNSKHFQGRKLRRGHPRHGGQGKGQSGRRFFRPRGKGKGKGVQELSSGTHCKRTHGGFSSVKARGSQKE